jgi:aminopeptidase
VRTEVEGELEALLTEGTDAQLEWINPARVNDIERADVRIVVEAESNTRAHTAVDPARQARRARAREPLLNRYLERAAAGELRSVITLYPTNAAAQDADRSLEDYEDFVYRAGLLDRDDPIGGWQALGAQLQRLANWLSGTQELRVVADGTDLTLGVEGRTWIPSEGRENFPDGELFTGPVETSVKGAIRFSYPASFAGRRIKDIELEFEDGEVVRARASQGEEFLREMLAMDDGARRVGEF